MSRFRTTRWSLIRGAREDSDSAMRALDELCRVYRPPILAYVRRHAPADAEDLTQAFFEQLLRLRAHEVADPERGRFRVFILVALRRFLANQSAARTAAKRGGGRTPQSLDADPDPAAQPVDHDTPDAAFERDWARAVLSQAMEQLRAEAAAADRIALFEAVIPFLLEAPDPDEYAAAAEKLGLRRNTLAVAIHRLRRRLRDLVRAALEETVGAPEALDAEIAVMRRALGGDGASAA